MIGNKKIFCVITARKGSVGIPGKNYRKLLDKPLFMWSVEAALQSKYVDIVAISSNCESCRREYIDFIRDAEFIEDRKETEVMWIQRPDKYSTPTSKNEDALIHALQQIKMIRNFIPEIIVNLQPTSPCRLNNLLDKCIEEYYNGEYDSLLTAEKHTPFMWQKKYNKWIYNVDKNDCCNRKMRQELEENAENSEFVWHDNGNIYMVDSKILLDKKCRIGYNPCIFETTGINNIQIDEEFDFKLIEKMTEIENLSSLV